MISKLKKNNKIFCNHWWKIINQSCEMSLKEVKSTQQLKTSSPKTPFELKSSLKKTNEPSPTSSPRTLGKKVSFQVPTTNKCKTCDKPILKEKIMVNESLYHSDCFSFFFFFLKNKNVKLVKNC
jgi:hypothetical protein